MTYCKNVNNITKYLQVWLVWLHTPFISVFTKHNTPDRRSDEKLFGIMEVCACVRACVCV